MWQGLPHAEGYYDDDDHSTDEGMHRIKPTNIFLFFPLWITMEGISLQHH